MTDTNDSRVTDAMVDAALKAHMTNAYKRLFGKRQSPQEFREDMRATLEAALSLRPFSTAVREGWKLVPIEPDDVMVADGCSMHVCEQGDSYYRDEDLTEVDCIAIYKAMLAAAPVPPAQEPAA